MKKFVTMSECSGRTLDDFDTVKTYAVFTFTDGSYSILSTFPSPARDNEWEIGEYELIPLEQITIEDTLIKLGILTVKEMEDIKQNYNKRREYEKYQYLTTVKEEYERLKAAYESQYLIEKTKRIINEK